MQKKFAIGIIGVGYVGLTLGSYLSFNDFCSLYLYDNNTCSLEEVLDRVGEIDSILGIEQANSQGRVFFNDETVSGLDMLFICVGTPLTKKSKEEQFQDFTKIILENIPKLQKGGSIFIRSTVLVGTSKSVNEALKSSGRGDLKVYSAPERTLEGAALSELRKLPQLLGAAALDDLEDGDSLLSQLGFEVHCVSTSAAAEFTKLICNSWRDSTFGFANELALLAKDLRLSPFEVIEAANFDYPRSLIPYPGPVGGPCLTKDTYILMNSLDQGDSKVSMMHSSRKVNERLWEDLINTIHEFVLINEINTILIVGVTFKGKPTTNDTRNSFGMDLLEKTTSRFPEKSIYVWDDNLPSNAAMIGAELVDLTNIPQTVELIVLANNANFYSSLFTKSYMQLFKNKVAVFDIWETIAGSSDDIEAEFYNLNGEIIEK